MSDPLEEAKKDAVFKNEYGIEYCYLDKKIFDRLTAEVERLRKEQYDLIGKVACQKDKAKDLTKERDALRSNMLERMRRVEEFEAENDTIKRDLMFYAKRNAELERKIGGRIIAPPGKIGQ